MSENLPSWVPEWLPRSVREELRRRNPPSSWSGIFEAQLKALMSDDIRCEVFNRVGECEFEELFLFAESEIRHAHHLRRATKTKGDRDRRLMKIERLARELHRELFNYRSPDPDCEEHLGRGLFKGTMYYHDREFYQSIDIVKRLENEAARLQERNARFITCPLGRESTSMRDAFILRFDDFVSKVVGKTDRRIVAAFCRVVLGDSGILPKTVDNASAKLG